MTKPTKPSEFGGRGQHPNTITKEATPSPADKLRLRYLTGQDDDPSAPVDPDAWEGG